METSCGGRRGGEGRVENKVLERRAFNAEMLLNEPSEGTIQGGGRSGK